MENNIKTTSQENPPIKDEFHYHLAKTLLYFMGSPKKKEENLAVSWGSPSESEAESEGPTNEAKDTIKEIKRLSKRIKRALGKVDRLRSYLAYLHNQSERILSKTSKLLSKYSSNKSPEELENEYSDNSCSSIKKKKHYQNKGEKLFEEEDDPVSSSEGSKSGSVNHSRSCSR